MDTTVLFDLTKRGKWEELEDVWLRYLDSPSLDPKFYAKLIGGMKKRKAEERCDQMIALLVQNLTESERLTDALRVARMCVGRMAVVDATREAVIASLRARYGKRETFPSFLEASGLQTEPDLAKSFTRFLTYANFDVGETYTHKTWGAGVVTAVDPAEGKVTFRFPDRPDADFTIAGAREFLTRLPRGHFLAQMARDRERMRQMADNQPAELLKIAAKSLGGTVRVSDLKREMTESLMDDGEWRLWWNRSRERIRVDPWIRFEGAGLNARLSLRDKPVSIHEQSLEALQTAESPRERMNAIRGCVRAHQKSPIGAEELRRIEEWIVNEFGATSHDGRSIEALFLLEYLRKIDGDHLAPPERNLERIVAECEDLAGAIRSLDVYEYQAPVVQAVARAREDWLAVYEAIIPEIPRRVAALAVAALRDGAHLPSLRHVAEAVLTDPRGNMETYLWAVSEYLKGEWDEFAPALSVEMMMEQLLECFSEIHAVYDPRGETAAEQRGKINAIRNFLEDRHHDNTRRAVAKMNEEGARRFYDRLNAHPALDSSEKAHLSGALRAERPELEVKTEENLLTSIYHYVSKDSYEAKMAELQRIRSQDIPRNSERVGLAADLGDLSENAEYDAAKEEQARLMARMNELDDLLRYARILDSETVQTTRCGPGTRVRIRDDREVVEQYVLMGLWDADPDNHVLSYRSPFGAQFLGKTVGETVEIELPNGEKRRCRVEAIENALKPSGAHQEA